MKKKNVIIIAVIGTVLVFLGGLLIVINQINTQNREKEKREKDLVSYYETFNKYASQFEEKNIEYAEVVSENMYYESVSD